MKESHITQYQIISECILDNLSCVTDCFYMSETKWHSTLLHSSDERTGSIIAEEAMELLNFFYFFYLFFFN